MSGVQRMHMFHLPTPRIDTYNPNPEYLVIERVFNLSVFGPAAPIMLTVDIVIKADDEGPTFYKQCHLAKDGKTFCVLKFSSMRVDA